jgi:capsular polysaccharide biosynthesis protein
MENKKWKVIQFEKMKLSEQIAIAKNARVLAGIHGAGLSNMIGMNHGGVVELGGESFRKCYLALAKVCSLEYTRLGFNEYKEYTPKNLVRKLAKEISASY